MKNMNRLFSLRSCVVVSIATLLTAAAVAAATWMPAPAPTGCAADIATDAVPCEVPLYGNAYLTAGRPRDLKIDAGGLRGWNDPKQTVSLYFAVAQPGELALALVGRNDGHPAAIEVGVAGETFELDVRNAERAVVPVGTVRIDRPGYVRVDLRGRSCRTHFGTYDALLLSGPAAAGRVTAIPGGEAAGDWPYWGRRGPSVHMGYAAPEGETLRYFYNEVTVPEGEDELHTYYMATGFNGGYMGMQVNDRDPKLRRILFSVWSAFTTDDPASIPEAYRVRMLRRGAGVHVGEFGNEGSGGQSYMHYPWEAGRTYRFLTEVRPDGPERTIFTGYFCGHDGVWRLVASFMRPEPGKSEETHYTGMHSFLENFDPAMGWRERRVRFGNQWVVTTDGRWIELTEGRFTVDNTGRSGIRLDFDGGVDGECFFLRNCGFFDGEVPYGSRFFRPATGRRPDVDLRALEAIPSVE